MAKSFTELVEIIYFTPENCEFYLTKNGFAAMRACVPPLSADDLEDAAAEGAVETAPPPRGGRGDHGGRGRAALGSVYREGGDRTPFWQDMGRVMFHKAFPFERPEEYISVQDEEGREYGIIRKLSDFDCKGREIIEGALKRKYFCPEIKKIHSLKEQFGYSLWRVDTDIGETEIVLKDTFGSILRVSETYLIITDVSGNRYSITDVSALDKKSYKKIELYL